MASKLRPQQANEIFHRKDKKTWKSDIFYFAVPYPKILIFFGGEVLPESLGTHNSEYVYKMGVTHIFDLVFLTQSR